MNQTHAGMLYCVLGYSAFSLSDPFYKWLLAEENFFHVMFWASLFCCVALEVGRPLLSQRPHPLRSKILPAHLARGLLSNLFFMSLMLALKFWPLATVTVVNFFTPLLTAVVARSFLKEPVSLLQWFALLLGLLGVMLVVQPNFERADPIWFLAFLMPCSLAALNIVTKKLLAHEQNPWAYAYFPCLLGMPLAILLSASLGIETIELPQFQEGPLLLGISVFEVAGLLLVNMGFARLPANQAGSFQYLQIIWAVLIGALIFKESISALGAVGIGCILMGRLNYLWRPGKALRFGWK